MPRDRPTTVFGGDPRSSDECTTPEFGNRIQGAQASSGTVQQCHCQTGHISDRRPNAPSRAEGFTSPRLPGSTGATAPRQGRGSDVGGTARYIERRQGQRFGNSALDQLGIRHVRSRGKRVAQQLEAEVGVPRSRASDPGDTCLPQWVPLGRRDRPERWMLKDSRVTSAAGLRPADATPPESSCDEPRHGPEPRRTADL